MRKIKDEGKINNILSVYTFVEQIKANNKFQEKNKLKRKKLKIVPKYSYCHNRLLKNLGRNYPNYRISKRCI